MKGKSFFFHCSSVAAPTARPTWISHINCTRNTVTMSSQAPSSAGKAAPRKAGKAWHSLASGAIAGALARTCTAPIDRIRILYQTSSTRRFSFANAWKTSLVILRDEGVAGFYRGNGASIVRVAPYAATIFTTFDAYEDTLTTLFDVNHSAWTRFCAGSLAGMTAVTLTYPLDLLRTRIAAEWGTRPADGGGRGRIWAHTLKACLREKGFPGLYAGLRPTLVGVVPYAGLNFTIYEGLKEIVLEQATAAATSSKFLKSSMLVSDGKTAVFVNLCCGALSGLIAQSATYPLHVLRRRQQVYGNKDAFLQKGIVQGLKHIYKNEGFAGLFKGMSLTWIKGPMAVALSFALNDYVRKKFQQRFGASVSEDEPWDSNTLTADDRQEHAADAEALWWAELDLVASLPPPLPGVSDPSSSTSTPVLSLSSKHADSDVSSTSSQSQSATLGDILKDNDNAAASAHRKDKDEDSNKEVKSAVKSMISGAMAGALAKTVIAPADRIKILYQVNPHRTFSLRSFYRTGSTIVTHAGIQGLWRGHSATLIRVMPSSAITYTTFSRYHNALTKTKLSENGEENLLTRFVAGAAAGTTSTAITYPLDLMRARMAAHWSIEPRYTSYGTAFREISRVEGLRSLYNGISPTLQGIVPYAGLSFMFFETFKSQAVARNWFPDDRIPPIPRLLMGGVAGLLAQSATYPLDIVRRRMQTMGPGSGYAQEKYASTTAAISGIYRTEGIRGLYKGLSLNWFKGPISIAISFTVNDILKHHFDI